MGDDEDDDGTNKLMMYRIITSVNEIKDKLLVLMVNSGADNKSEEPQTSLDDIVLQVSL